MEIRLLLGPAGSGKTHRCLGEIRDELRRNPSGAPLLLLAPKQSTFQLERQLLDEGGVPGWTRLQILSFDRLARMVLEQEGPVELLDEEGRVMVLRALLRWNQSRLRLFRASARMTGFARELSGTMRELQRYRVTPERLEGIAAELPRDQGALSDKLRDLAVMGRAYREWLEGHRLQDGDLLPELAAERLRVSGERLAFDGVWMDGFAEMTPQEIELLAAVARVARTTTLAFCLDDAWREDPPWLSTWAVVGQTARRVHARLSALNGATVLTEVLRREPDRGRFRNRPALAHLESTWTRPVEATGRARDEASGSLRLVACGDFEREAEVAAREVWRHVRSGGRFRDVAVIVRSFDGRDADLRRVFLRYGIPFFLDRRESLAHHPLAELTRCALRLMAFTPRHEDWFGALKTGLVGLEPEVMDAWENEALAAGWAVEPWLRGEVGVGGRVESESRGSTASSRWKRELAGCTAPFRDLGKALGDSPDGFELAKALRGFWSALGVRERLADWAAADARHGGQLELQARVHGTAWEQMEIWLSGLERGFESTRLPRAEWVPIVDAGLASLTAGVIPPSQDQVMIGAIDRSRQPELRLAIVMGLNEGDFPAPPRGGGILGERDRDALAAVGVGLEVDRRRKVGQERYLGYVALTRSGARSVMTWSERDATGRPRNPSPFVAHVRAVFPELPVDAAGDEAVPADGSEETLAERVEHRSELLPWVLARGTATAWDALAGDGMRRGCVKAFRARAESESLRPAVVTKLYGEAPEISVSALESLAACPFQFFVRRGLRGRERTTFEVDRRHTGSLAHELLARFHAAAVAGGRRWRDWSPREARALLAEVANRHLATYAGGIFLATPEARWEAVTVVERLQELVGVLVGWMGSYGFDPSWAEVEFGGSSPRPAWTFDLGEGRSLRIRGKVDRVDTWRSEEGGVWYVVVDYKLRARRLDERMVRAGIDLQLVAYALALSQVLDWDGGNGGGIPELAGFCYVGLGGGRSRASSRVEGWGEPEPSESPYRHRGRLRVDVASALDNRTPQETSGQFALKFKKDGTPSKQGDGKSADEFSALLGDTREVVRRLGRQLLSGNVTVAPFRAGSRTACDECELRAVCRFDAWTQSFRRIG